MLETIGSDYEASKECCCRGLRNRTNKNFHKKNKEEPLGVWLRSWRRDRILLFFQKCNPRGMTSSGQVGLELGSSLAHN